jgi:acyl-CoA thioester hydrolase
LAVGATGQRSDYAHYSVIPTRWEDNDAYGHVNNIVYYSFFDTAITEWLIDAAGLDPYAGDVIGLCIASACDYHGPFAFPDKVEAGIRVGHLGRSSVRYEVGLFKAGEDAPVAEGSFTHVYVDRGDRIPTKIPDGMRKALETLILEPKT